MSMPSVLAVCRLMTELELGRQLDRHVGRFLALEDAAGIDAGLAKLVRKVRSVAHQPAGFGKFTPMVHRGKRMTRRQRDELHATGDEQHIGTDQECIGPLFHERRKGRIDVAIRTGGDDFDLPPDGRSRRLHFCDKGLGNTDCWD